MHPLRNTSASVARVCVNFKALLILYKIRGVMEALAGYSDTLRTAKTRD